MSRVHGKDLTAINVDDSGGVARDLKAETLAIGFEVSAEVHDTTTIGDQWKEATPGLKGGDEFDHEVFYDNAAAPATWQLYNGRLGGAAQTFSFTDAVRTVSMETIVTRLSMPISVADMIKFTARHRITGAVTFS